MAFWSTQRFLKEQKILNLISPFNHGRVEQGHYELSLSREVLTTEVEKRRTSRGKGEMLEIRPGQFALLYTFESVSIPTDAIAFISIKATIKLKGLVNVSGFHVDPGFKGKIKFSVYNAANKSIFIKYGDPLFLIWFADLDQPTKDPYQGKHKGQNGITTTDHDNLSGRSHSPSALNERLESLEGRFRLAASLAGIFIGVTVLPLIISITAPTIQRYIESKSNKKHLEKEIQLLKLEILDLKFKQENSKPKSLPKDLAPER